MNYVALALQYLQMIEVFRTNVSTAQQANELICLLRNFLPGSTISFDLEDCDRVLRIDSEIMDADSVTSILTNRGFACCAMQ